MAIVRWRPFEDFMSVQDEMSSFFDNFFGRRLPTKRMADSQTAWLPRVDISENEDEILVKADVPGITKEDIKITLSDNVLSISGEKKTERNEEDENYHRVERVFGSFERNFYIPKNVDAAKISAKYTDGVLAVSLPKKEEAKPKEIPVDVE